MGVDLSLKDIRFLRAVRDINNDPEAYPETDRGEVPANKASIREVTEMTSKAVEYRLGSSDNHRGFTQEDMGLVEVHSPTIEGNTFGPKSAELTSKGLEELSKVEDEGVLGDGESSESEAIKQLRARLEEIENTEISEEGEVTTGELAAMVEQVRTQIDELESRIDSRYESLESRIEGIESGQTTGEWGGVSDNKVEDLEGVLKMAPAIAFAWSEVFGVSLQEIIHADNVTEDMIEGYRETAAQSLESVSAQNESVGDSNELPVESDTDAGKSSGDSGGATGESDNESVVADDPSPPIVDEADTDGGEVQPPQTDDVTEDGAEQVTLDGEE